MQQNKYGGLMENNIVQKTFLDADDICSIFNCCKTKSYQIINDINRQLMKKGYMTFKGRVLADEVYRSFNMSNYLDKHDTYVSKQV